MKKVLAMILSLTLVVTLTIGGSIAYLTSEDSDVNVMTLGNVQIEQNEYQRAIDTETGKLDEANIVSFTDNKPLLPAVAGSGDKKQITVDGYNVQIRDDEIVTNYVDKIVNVKNIGKSDAYVRTLYAFPNGGIPHNENAVDASDQWLHWNGVSNTDTTPNNGWIWGKDKTTEWPANNAGWNVYTNVEINGITYDVFIATNKNVIAENEITAPSLVGLYMDSNVDYDNDKQQYVWTDKSGTDHYLTGISLEEPFEVLTLSQGVQADGFTDAWAAFDAAFPIADVDTLAEWFGAAIDKENPDAWDGTSDTSWYNDTDTEFVLTTAEQLAGLAKLVDGGKNFAGKTVKLGKDIDLADKPFNPIGHSSNGKSFNGTFDGQGHKISNMYMQNDLAAWQYEGEYYGLFAYTNGATIKNVTMADGYISSGRNEAASIVGNAEDTKFENISIEGMTLIGYNNSVGGVASECYGNCSFTNITVDDKTVIGPLWGTYDVRLGGVVGLVHAGNNVTFKDIDVACKLDAINDVAANYQYWCYRYCGMLIGHVDGVNGVADPTGYVTCENVKVTYGDWVDYHYCEDADLGAGSYNGPGEYKYARVEAGTGTDGIDLTQCNHNADESHNVLITFDQLFGGGQGVSGLKTYDGVTVNYPNK